ncbi:MAG: NADH-quinone oxidoreductase subunit L [Deltaproteobacteria bacterium]|nr:NADH-quinone oxidoreductase subunit L [Deltaproteobacteria bacterium]
MNFSFPLYLIPLFPLLGALVNGLIAAHVAYRRQKPSEKLISFIAVLFPLAAFFIALSVAYPILSGAEHETRETLFQWMGSGTFQLDFALRVDRLSSIMVLIVTGIGTLIHLYSTSYMHGEQGFARYFSYLNLFLFAMLMLILGDNLLVLFLGWEGVGLCSYLLIGFWFDDPAKASAGKKAFVVNRIGDFGFILALFLISSVLLKNPEAASQGIFSFQTLETYKELLAPLATLICLFLFVGACGKSAQIPLYVWLPDAMAGPTPVSALIHAATMVTAGVYMVARLHFLFDLAPVAREVIAYTGAATALFAASIGLVQRDIKKVLAYSTVSQLGYMFIGVGLGASSAGIFHLATHAFFKACLFLGSGSVIHAMHGEQDIFKMGGLRKWMPVTSITFLISTIAIAGIPPFSGFFSKDEILWQAYSRGYPIIWAMGFVAAGFTAFYMFRLTILTFFGNCRADHHTQEHLHESPWQMTFPLVILALLAAGGGLMGVPHVIWGGHNWIHHYLEIEGGLNRALPVSEEELEHSEMLFAIGSAVWALFWSFVAIALYRRGPQVLESLANRLKCLYNTLMNKYYIDEIYEALIVTPIHKISETVLWKGFDAGIIDTIFVNGTARAAQLLGQCAGLLQNGLVNAYSLYFGLAVLGLLWWVLG